jgi:hypothetical protein
MLYLLPVQLFKSQKFVAGFHVYCDVHLHPFLSAVEIDPAAHTVHGFIPSAEYELAAHPRI